MVKISAFAVLAAVVAMSPASAQSHHKAAAYRGHTSSVAIDPNGLHAFALVPPGARSDDPALTGGGSAGYNAGLRNNF
jgi:hypothetical protein